MGQPELRPEGLLQNILTYLCFKANPLSTTKLVKLTYVVDVYHARMFGARLTEVPFRHHYYGAWAPNIDEEIEKLCGAGVIREETVITKKGFVAVVPIPKVNETTVTLTKTAIEALEAVIADWGAKSPDEVAEYTKKTLPFLGTPFGELIDFSRVDFATEFAKEHGISVDDAATEDILGDEDLLLSVLEGDQELKKSSKLLEHADAFGPST